MCLVPVKIHNTRSHWITIQYDVNVPFSCTSCSFFGLGPVSTRNTVVLLNKEFLFLVSFAFMVRRQCLLILCGFPFSKITESITRDREIARLSFELFLAAYKVILQFTILIISCTSSTSNIFMKNWWIDGTYSQICREYPQALVNKLKPNSQF